MTDITLSIQPTSSPDIIKLEANKALVKGSYEYKNIDEAKNSPLAKELFYLPFVKTVYISSNFIALKRFPIIEWKDVQEEVAQQVQLYIQSGREIVSAEGGREIAITVYTETTPNPSVMKFVANKRLVPTIIEYKAIEETTEAPIAKALFTQYPFIEEIFFDDNYISLTKKESEEWEMVTSDIRDFIRKYISEGRTLITSSEIKRHQQATQERLLSMVTTDEVSKEIVAIIDEFVKPAVASDGGNIQFISYNPETHYVEVILQGACSGCPSSTLTLKKGIEVILKDKLQNPYINVNALNG
ncbi:NifU family protein [Capnocytophaga sp. HP1101]